MKIIKNKNYWTIFCLLSLTIPLPADAFEITFDSSIGEVYNNVPASSNINQTNTPDGFGNYNNSTDDFFDSPFVLLGAKEDKAISDNGNSLINIDVLNTAIFGGIEITEENQNKDIAIEFDWIFQGNQKSILGLNLDTFVVAVVGTGANPLTVDVDLDSNLQLTNTYSYKRNNSFIIDGGLPIDSYTIQATLLEAPDVAGILTKYDNSAVGIGNLSATAVPFEFSPTLGLLIVGSFWGLSYYKKQKKNLKQLLPKP